MAMKLFLLWLAFGLFQAPALAVELVGYERNNGSFWTIDLTSGNRALLGRGSGLSSFEDFEYAPDGTLVGYERNNGSFWTIDLTSGNRALLGRGSGLSSFEDFEYAPALYYTPEPGPLLLLVLPLALLLTAQKQRRGSVFRRTC